MSQMVGVYNNWCMQKPVTLRYINPYSIKCFLCCINDSCIFAFDLIANYYVISLVTEAVTEHLDYIQTETLCEACAMHDALSGEMTELDLNGKVCAIQIEPV